MTMVHLKELMRITEATSGGGFFTEANGYSDSGEFTNEFYDLFGQVTKMKKIMKNQKWIDYMKLTDFNNDTSTEQHARDAIKAIVALEKCLNEIDAEFDKANGHSDSGEDDESLEGEFESGENDDEDAK